MRLGVLDIGSNTGHLLVVDAHRGAAPLPAYSHKEPLRLAEHLEDGEVTRSRHQGADQVRRRRRRGRGGQGLRRTCSGSRPRRCATPATATPSSTTSPTRPASAIAVLPGEDEARLTFLAVRRWFGWSAGRLAVFDIGGGSLEIAGGSDEEPDVAWSIPLGAARLARELLPRRRRRTRRRSGRCARRSAPTSPRTPGTCCAAGRPTWRPPPRRPSARWRASAAPRPSERRPAGRPRRSALADLAGVDPEAGRHDAADELADLPGRLAEPDPPDRAGRAGRRGRDGHLRPRGARRSARGRCARA